MFGANRVWQQKQFASLPLDSLKVTSLFRTLQGEGPFAGRSAIFLRLAHCNLQCKFCDTYFDAGEIMAVGMLWERIREMAGALPTPPLERPLLVVTGGEPMLQPHLGALLTRAERGGFDTQIESNGLVYTNIPITTHLVISPKAAARHTSAARGYITLDSDALQRADTLKFVVSATEPPYNDLPAWALDWAHMPGRPSKRIYVSPMNCYSKQPAPPINTSTLASRNEAERISFWTPGLLDNAANQLNHEHAARLAMQYGVRLSLQMHLYASLP